MAVGLSAKAPAALYPQEDSWYLFLLEAEPTPGPRYHVPPRIRRENESTRRKPGLYYLASNPGNSGGNPTTNRLSRGMGNTIKGKTKK
jgi:hypothetical protein